MASRKKTLDTALGSLLTPGTAGPASGSAPAADAANRGNAANGATAGAASGAAPAGNAAPDDDGAAAGYVRTSTGYHRASGETVRRLSLFLTERQRRDLRRLAVDAGAENVTEYVVEALGLGRTNPGP